MIFSAGKFLKKQVKKAVFGHFLENVDKQNCVFLARSLPQSWYLLVLLDKVSGYFLLCKDREKLVHVAISGCRKYAACTGTLLFLIW